MPFSNLMQHTLITFATEDEVGLESKGDLNSTKVPSTAGTDVRNAPPDRV